jgi:hypothetical protein
MSGEGKKDKSQEQMAEGKDYNLTLSNPVFIL